MSTGAFVPPGSLVPLFPAAATMRDPIMGRLTAWNSTTRANTVVVLGQNRVNLSVLQSAEATLTAPCTILLIPIGETHNIAGRIRVP